jgi:hypothetical protein
VPRWTSTPIALCVSLRVADIFSHLSVSADRLLLAALIMKASPPPTSNEKYHILLPDTWRSPSTSASDLEPLGVIEW